MQAHAKQLAGAVKATVAYSSVMGQHAPEGVPLILDMVDVDSEKWLAYAHTRKPGFLYGLEGRHLRSIERLLSRRAESTFLATEPERDLLRSVATSTGVSAMENGVDWSYFDPSRAYLRPFTAPTVVFCGAMDYYPNIEAVAWFADEVFPELRRRRPEIQFWIVGRDPSPKVWRLGRRPGIRVTGSVPDIRPYLAGAEHVVAPLSIARGIQNKVLEALAMGKVVLASPAVCRTFGSSLPAGVVQCQAASDYLQTVSGSPDTIRSAAVARFDWTKNLQQLEAAVQLCIA